jgi:hypothetical protein
VLVPGLAIEVIEALLPFGVRLVRSTCPLQVPVPALALPVWALLEPDAGLPVWIWILILIRAWMKLHHWRATGLEYKVHSTVYILTFGHTTNRGTRGERGQTNLVAVSSRSWPRHRTNAAR